MKALVLQVGINAVNIAVTMLLVLTLGMGVAGAAAAALIAETAGHCRRPPHHLSASDAVNNAPSHLRPCSTPPKLIRMIAVNRDIMIRTAALNTPCSASSRRKRPRRRRALAANAVLNNFLLVCAFFLDGFATAAEQLCGRAFGAHDREAFTGAVRLVVAGILALRSRSARSSRCSARR